MKGKLSPGYVGAYEIWQRVGQDTYELTLPSELSSVHPVFHISMRKKITYNPETILPIEGLGVQENLFMRRFLLKSLIYKFRS